MIPPESYDERMNKNEGKIKCTKKMRQDISWFPPNKGSSVPPYPVKDFTML